MAQHDYVIANGTGAAVRSDLNNALAAIVSQNSGATEPATTYAFQFWADTTTGTLKLRNSANSAWIELLQLDGTLTMEDGTEALPGLSFRSDLDTGLWRPGTNQLAISTNAVERVEFGASEVVFNDGGANYDFRVEGDTNANLLFVDASADAVGIGTSTPSSDGPLTLANAAETPTIFFSRPSAGSFSAAIQASGYGTLTFYNGAASSTVAGLTPRMTIDGQNGRVGIGTATPSAKLEVSGGNIRLDNNQGVEWGGANNYIYGNESTDFIAIATNGNERARIDSSGRWLLGTSTARGDFFNTSNRAPSFQVEGTTTNTSGISVTSNQNNDNGPEFNFGKSRGTNTGSSTIVSSGDGLGRISFQGTDGSELVPAAYIEATVDGTPGTNDMPGRLVFSTTADGASSPTERLRIANNGQLSAVVPGNSTLYPGFMSRAWVNFDGTGTVAIRASGNVSSITDNGSGSYTVNLTTAMPDTSYCVQSCGVNGGVSNAFAFPEVASSSTLMLQTATRSAPTTNADINGIYVAIFR